MQTSRQDIDRIPSHCLRNRAGRQSSNCNAKDVARRRHALRLSTDSKICRNLVPGLRVRARTPIEDENVDEDNGRDLNFRRQRPISGMCGVERVFPIYQDMCILSVFRRFEVEGLIARGVWEVGVGFDGRSCKVFFLF